MAEIDRELWARIAVLQAWVHRESDNVRRRDRQAAVEAIRAVVKIAKEHYTPRGWNLDIEIEQAASQMIGPVPRSR